MITDRIENNKNTNVLRKTFSNGQQVMHWKKNRDKN